MRLLFELRPEKIEPEKARVLKRRASRGIILKGEQILLLYTKRYNDFSFPGGGVNEDEDLQTGLCREIMEETGAQKIKIVQNFGYVDELRPHYRPDFDLIHMLSYFFVCQIEGELAKTKLESYEIENGSKANWVNIHEAIKHNQMVMQAKDKSMGLSIPRETRALKLVVNELVL